MRKLLVANRGEIAIRVFRTAREMGIGTVAVFSEADRTARHVEFADEAVPIGAAEPSASYLNIDAILAAAEETGADAIHPGYGFLSERPEFSEACERAGIAFVGPPALAMQRLGSKSEAKALAVSAGVPIVPGCFEQGASDERLAEAAHDIGFPVLLKASAGGGGRGMRIVGSDEDFHPQLRIARDEALKAFGDGTMMVEKLVDRPRHVEVQVLADRFGNIACLFERECSIQRRHQKMLEESPAPISMDFLWPRMQEAARKLVSAAGYVGAGTIEFIVDEAAGEFYFLEVNARLQVEHPVTEWVTGLDLVAWQIRIADGERLELPSKLMLGDREAIQGRSLELRIIAEDPRSGFLPSIGRIEGWAEPSGPGVRVDSGYGPGREVSRFYDSLLAKLIVHAGSRADAIAKARSALLDFHILGVKTNIEYLLQILDHPSFESGRFDTGFIDRECPPAPDGEIPEELGAILAASLPSSVKNGEPERLGAWDLADGFRNSRA